MSEQVHPGRAPRPAPALCIVWALITFLAPPLALPAAPPHPEGLAPAAIVAGSQPGSPVFIACANSRELLQWDAVAGSIAARIPLPAPPSGMTLAADGRSLWITCSGPVSTVVLLNPVTRAIEAAIPAGHTSLAPVASPDGRLLYVCNRFNNEVAVLDVPARRWVARIPVPREPVAAVLSPDGRTLFVANHLHAGRADDAMVAAEVTVIETAACRVSARITLPHGSGLLFGMALGPEGRHLAVTHNLARPNLPTTQVDRGWMNTAALSLVDTAGPKLINTVLLDSVDLGAANPWAVTWTPDGTRLLVTHAGTHELSLIDAPALLARLAALPEHLPPGTSRDPSKSSNVAADVPNDLAFLVGIRQRIPLTGRGPRSMTLVPRENRPPRLLVAHYFSDALDALEPASASPAPHRFPLAPEAPLSQVRQGEAWFNDATLCFQHWQSCASCHSADARVDALNWDLLNDGIGNPKNNKSLLWSHRTPPAMSGGVRETAEEAVRAGIRHILFTVQPPEVAEAMDAYLKSLQPESSPYLVDGALSDSAKRGQLLFHDPDVGCASCHVPGLLTDLKSYDVGTRGPLDRFAEFDTPTLVELWRTSPYLHDGSAVTIQEVLTTRNRGDAHGKTSHLSPAQINDLAAFVLSL